ncbi:hypothetical protein ACFELC_23695 [Pseudomonas aeruginosa]|uniref:hypothetical protein n=1 Tax=Pseudomonas aeruginosa TaxID=287 RepID=UPI003839F2EE
MERHGLLTTLFGKTVADPAVEAMFQLLGIRRRPKLAHSVKNSYEATLRAGAQGMRFTFTERNYWEGLKASLHGKSKALIFTNVTVIAGIPGVLPFGLQWKDDRATTRKKLLVAGWGDRLRAHGRRDVWWLPDYRIRVTYQPGDIDPPEAPAIFEISLGIPMPTSVEPFHRRRYPTPEQVCGLFGESPASPMFLTLFGDFDPIRLMTFAVGQEVVDRKHEYGFALYFDKARRAPDGRPSFAGISMCRDRLWGTSTAWRGRLPFGLDFDDPPGLFEERLGRKADYRDDTPACGTACWLFPDRSIWVNFDNLDNCIEQVFILRAGYTVGD